MDILRLIEAISITSIKKFWRKWNFGGIAYKAIRRTTYEEADKDTHFDNIQTGLRGLVFCCHSSTQPIRYII